jgi:hypothetical protein
MTNIVPRRAPAVRIRHNGFNSGVCLKRAIIGAILTACAFGQSTETLPKFDAADVHVSPKAPAAKGLMGQFVRTSPVRNGRYEIKTATMLDLIRIAYGFQPDKILGDRTGSNWAASMSSPRCPTIPLPIPRNKCCNRCFQERFHKEADGSEQTGCRPRSVTGNGPNPGGRRGAIHGRKQ